MRRRMRGWRRAPRGGRPLRFDEGWQRRRARAARWRAWRWWLVLAAILGGIAALRWLWPAAPRTGEELAGPVAVCGEGRAAICAPDGDTLIIGQRRVRLTGYNAPEIAGACAAERQLALRARGDLVAWTARGPFLLDGGADPPRDIYGRELRAAWRIGPDGREDDLAEAMIAAGSARADGDRDWCSR